MADIPRSVAPVRILAPLVMAVSGLLTIVATLGILPDHPLVPFAAFGIPTIGTTLVAKYLAEGRGLHASGAFCGWLCGHVMLGVVLGVTEGPHDQIEAFVLCALVASGLTGIFALPPFILAFDFGRRSSLDAGDVFLAGAGLWLTTLLAAAIVLVEKNREYCLPGLVLGIGMLSVGIARRIERRRWYARIVRGETTDYRIREARSDEEASAIPALFTNATGATGATAIVERLEPTSTPYRTGLVGLAVARVAPSRQ